MNRLYLLKTYIAERGWTWEPGKPVPYGEQIVITNGRQKATVTYYPKRGAMVPGGAASDLRAELETWIEGRLIPVRPAAPATPAEAPRSEEPTIPLPHAGMDESGKGDWYGPLVVAAVYLDESTAELLQAAGVCDSKKLNAVGVQRMAGEIDRAVPEEWRRVTALLPEEYNRRYDAIGNLNLLLAALHAENAVPLREVAGERFVCDQFAQRLDVLESAFREVGLPRPRQLPRAESASLAVAAASILASAAYADALVALGEEFGLPGPLPRGASDVTTLERTARTVLREHGRSGLARVAKLHFKPIQELLASVTSTG